MSEPVAAPALLRTPSHPAGAWCACAMVASGAAIVLWTSATVGYGGPAAVALLTALTTPADPPSFALCVWWPGGAAGSLGRWIWINRVCATHCGGGAGGCPPPRARWTAGNGGARAFGRRTARLAWQSGRTFGCPQHQPSSLPAHWQGLARAEGALCRCPPRGRAPRASRPPRTSPPRPPTCTPPSPQSQAAGSLSGAGGRPVPDLRPGPRGSVAAFAARARRIWRCRAGQRLPAGGHGRGAGG